MSDGNEIFWIGDKVAQNMYDITWHPGQENLEDYQSKHHIGAHHVAVRPWYLHNTDSPRYLGVLELSKTGTYGKYPYQEFHEYRVQVLLLAVSYTHLTLPTKA